MHAWESIQKTVDYIEDNIGDEIQLEQLAKVANLSYFYFHRLFSRLVKKSVQEYIKLRRLARACDALRDKNNRIIDVAFSVGFSSHETFTRAFKDAYGITPAEYRENSVPLKHFNKPDLLLDYVMVDEGVPLISNGMVLEMSRRTLEAPMHFVGVAGHMRIDGAVSKKTGIDEPGAIWGRFGNSDIKCKPDGRTVGASYYGKNTPRKCFTYFAGAETTCEHDYENTSHDKWQLPAGEYIVCAFEAESFDALVTDVLYKANDYAYSWRERHGLTCGDFTAELYYKNTTDVAYMEVWVPVKEKLVDFEIKTLPRLWVVGKQIRYSWVALENGDNRLPAFWNQCIDENVFALLEVRMRAFFSIGNWVVTATSPMSLAC